MSGSTFFSSNTNSSANAYVSGTGTSAYGNAYGSSNTNGYAITKGNPNIAVTPGSDIVFEQNFKKSPVLQRSGVTVEIIEAKPSFIKYRLISN